MSFTINTQYAGRQHVLSCEPIIKGINSSSGIQFSGRWDIGATMTIVSSRVVKKLKLVPTDSTSLITANGRIVSYMYDVIVQLSDKIHKQVLAIEADLGSAGDVLIGMDIIGDGDFAISSDKYGNTCLAYRSPSNGRISFKD